MQIPPSKVLDAVSQLVEENPDKYVNTHDTKPLVTTNGRKVNIDIEIADVVEGIWRAGIDTMDSCQNIGEYLSDKSVVSPRPLEIKRRQLLGTARLGFFTAEDALQFMNVLAAVRPSGDLLERMRSWNEPMAWRWTVGISDTYPWDDSCPVFAINSYGLHLPPTDLPAVASLLNNYNDQIKNTDC